MRVGSPGDPDRSDPIVSSAARRYRVRGDCHRGGSDGSGTSDRRAGFSGEATDVGERRVWLLDLGKMARLRNRFKPRVGKRLRIGSAIRKRSDTVAFPPQRQDGLLDQLLAPPQVGA